MQYKDRAYEILDNLERGQIYDVIKSVKPEHTNMFFDLVKMYMNEFDYQGGIEISSDWTKVKRINDKK